MAKNKITRRDFLKLAGLIPLSLVTPSVTDSMARAQQSNAPQNVIIVVFDAFSAHHISLYGYPRETTPNISRLAERAIVYHNHHAGGNYTTPGTASLLTGTLPWTHRAFQSGDSVDGSFTYKNVFSAFQKHYRLAYSHNVWVYSFLNQFKRSLNKYIPMEEYLLETDVLIPQLFRYDVDIANLAWDRIINNKDNGFAYSLFLSDLHQKSKNEGLAKSPQLKAEYPLGVPKNQFFSFLLEQAIDSIGALLPNLQQPFMGYFHFFPPHAPYNTHRNFVGRFKNDGYLPTPKPLDIFHQSNVPSYVPSEDYDEFILYVDREFGRFYDSLARNGMLENTWIILTSDHGEMLERGIVGHTTPVLYEPLIHIPLIIFEPGRTKRLDIHTITSAIDVLPTLLHLTGQPPADWAEGFVMPPFSNTYPGDNRTVYALEAKKNPKYKPLTVASVAMIKGSYKLTYFTGYEELGGKGSERIDLYDLGNDPEELNNLYTTKRETAGIMFDELKSKLAEVNKPYLSPNKL